MLDWIINSFKNNTFLKPTQNAQPYKISKIKTIHKNLSQRQESCQTLEQPPKCDICRITTLGRNSNVATPSCCRHIFCENCLTDWTKRSDATCPTDQKPYEHFLVYDSYSEAFTSNHTFAIKYTVRKEFETESLWDSTSSFSDGTTTSASDFTTDVSCSESEKYLTAVESTPTASKKSGDKHDSVLSICRSKSVIQKVTVLNVTEVEFTVQYYLRV